VNKSAPLSELLVIEICRELYDRFMMGGWEPQDAHDWLRRKLAENPMTKNSNLSAPAASPSRGNEAPHNSVTVRFGFGEFDLSTLKEDEFVTASGLNDGGWVVCKRLPSTPEETGPPKRKQRLEPRHEAHLDFSGKNGLRPTQKYYSVDVDDLESGAAPSSVTPREDILKWLDAYGIAQDFDTNDGIALIQAWESARASSPSSATEPQNWISVSEKLPAKGWSEMVIAFNGVQTTAKVLADPKGESVWVAGDQTLTGVTHWRELPKSPSSAGTPEGK
jgi:hypothetical protein